MIVTKKPLKRKPRYDRDGLKSVSSGDVIYSHILNRSYILQSEKYYSNSFIKTFERYSIL